ncbi:hypothetical protein AB4Y89_15475 [Terriglobus sp. 2YAB30_2]|uniref:hypothetical protein n=1 Tax=Terriglobus sp. 2YAB30_2 TaxID=3233023 RepID=UPI003F96C21D
MRLSRLSEFALAVVLSALTVASPAVRGQQIQATIAEKPEIVEWVYRVRYGYRDEWFDLFRKNQVSILERQKQLGYVKEYTIYAPSLHTSEDSRWDYRIVIIRRPHDAPVGESEGEIARQLFPDQATYRREENRRWELTTNHWDLPIHVVDVTQTK